MVPNQGMCEIFQIRFPVDLIQSHNKQVPGSPVDRFPDPGTVTVIIDGVFSSKPGIGIFGPSIPV